MCVLHITVDDCGEVCWPMDLIEEHSLTIMTWSGFIVQPGKVSEILFSDKCCGSLEIIVLGDNCVCWSVFSFFWMYGWTSLPLTESEVICSSVFNILGGGWELLSSLLEDRFLWTLLDSELVTSICITIIYETNINII